VSETGNVFSRFSRNNKSGSYQVIAVNPSIVSSVEKCPVRAGSGVVRIDPLRFLAGPPDVAKSD